MRPRGVFLVLFLGFLIFPGTARAAEFLDYYRSGLEARDAGDWALVESMMRQAIAIKPEEKKRLLVRRSSYFPHFYLGLARYRQGDCPRALAAWSESENQGAIVGRPEFLELAQMRSDCQDDGVPSLNTAASKPEPGQAAEKESAGGAEEGAEKATEKEPEGGRLKRAARKGQRVVSQGAEPTRKGLSAVEKVAPEDSKVGKWADQGQGAVDLAEVGAEAVNLVLTPEQRLRAAIDAYFVGKPRRTLDLLANADLSDPRAKTQVYLFRAAASFRLHRMAGEGESRLKEARLKEARKNAQLFRQQDWREDFPAEFFDPEFVRFVQGGG